MTLKELSRIVTLICTHNRWVLTITKVPNTPLWVFFKSLIHDTFIFDFKHFISFSNYIHVILKASPSLRMWFAKCVWVLPFSCLETLSEAPLRAVGFSEFWDGRMRPLMFGLMGNTSFYFQLNWAIITGEWNPSFNISETMSVSEWNMHVFLLKSKTLSKSRPTKPHRSF